MHVGNHASRFFVGLGALGLACSQATAADRVFTKSGGGGGKMAAKLVQAMPPAPAGWKITETTKATLPSSYKGRTVVVPAVQRNFKAVTGRKQFNLAIQYVYAADRKMITRNLEKRMLKDRELRRIRIKGYPGYFAHGGITSEFSFLVGAYLVNGTGLRADPGQILATLKQLDVGTLKALQ